MLNIAIPTYDRSDCFKTIKYLRSENVPDEWISIFFANEEEKEKYVSKMWENKYNLIVGVLGICNQRNFITNYYDEDEIIVSMDDDIEKIEHKNQVPFLEWVQECINYMKEKNLGLVSVAPSSNPYFFKMKNKSISFRTGNYLAVGVFQIYKNHKSLIMDIQCAEDYDRSIMYIQKYGENIRYQDVFLKTVYWGKGGLTSQRTKEWYLCWVEKLMEKYPNVFKTRMRLIPKISKTEKVPILYLPKKSFNFF